MLDIVLLAFNNLDITSRALSALVLYRPKGSRIILVDNGSTDGPEGVASLKGTVEAHGGTYIRVPENKGVYHGANIGLAAVTSDVFYFLCNDIVVMPGTIDAAVAAVSEKHPIIGSFGFVRADFDFHSLQVEAVVSGTKTSAAYTPIRGHFSAFAARKDLFSPEQNGLFDEGFHVTFGDTDWEERLGQRRVTYLQAIHSTVYHGHSVTRKRLGAAHDAEVDDKDHKYFLRKWATHPIVAARHPYSPPNERLPDTIQAFTQGEP